MEDGIDFGDIDFGDSAGIDFGDGDGIDFGDGGGDVIDFGDGADTIDFGEALPASASSERIAQSLLNHGPARTAVCDELYEASLPLRLKTRSRRLDFWHSFGLSCNNGL